MRPSYPQLVGSARYYPYALDPCGGWLDVLEVDRAFYAASFLDERALAARKLSGWRYPLTELLDARRNFLRRDLAMDGSADRPLRWIFHVGHCGSTLLSRMLESLPGVLGLREPQPLLAVATAQMERDAPLGRLVPDRIDALIALTAECMACGFEPDERVVVKSTSTASLVAPRLLSLREQDRAVLITLPLPRYLAVYLRDPVLRAQARADALPRLACWHQETGDTSLRLWQLDDAQCIALNWRVDTHRFARLAANPSTARRVLSIDGESLIADPVANVQPVARHFGIENGGMDADAGKALALSRQYAKDTARPFDRASRERDLDAAEREFARSIDAAIEWIGSLPIAE